MEVLKIILSALAGALGGGGILGFVQFLINRKDDQKNELAKIGEEIKKLAKIDDVARVEMKVNSMDEKMNENEATSRRVRILRFSDELMQNVWHSKDSFDQAILDCDYYEDYCAGHPQYKNSITGAAVDYIRTTYRRCLEEHSFLTKKVRA